MTETEWPACADPDPMLASLGATASQRKFRLFAVACCRRQPATREAWPWGERAVDVAEQFCDGLTDTAALGRAQTDVESRLELYPGEPVYNAGFWACSQDIVSGVRGATFYAANLVASSLVECSSGDFDDRYAAVREQERRCQCVLLRDVFGNPFRPAATDPSWRCSTVVALAHRMYESRDFSAMPILAGALQDAGCDNDDVLDHCRGLGLHVRGCWVVDVVRGKE